MADIISTSSSLLDKTPLNAELLSSAKILTGLIEENAYVGEVYSLGYEEALVQIHDYHRQLVGGIPALSLPLAYHYLPKQILGKRMLPSFFYVFWIKLIFQMQMKLCASGLKMLNVSVEKLKRTGMTEV
jgi:hypothetical protein